MSKRFVTLKLDGLEVIGIKWRIEFHQEGHLGYKECLRRESCVYCGGPSQTWEHVIPRSLDGGDGWDNIVRACRDCNFKRATQPFFIFMLTGRRPANEHKKCSSTSTAGC